MTNEELVQAGRRGAVETMGGMIDDLMEERKSWVEGIMMDQEGMDANDEEQWKLVMEGFIRAGVILQDALMEALNEVAVRKGLL